MTTRTRLEISARCFAFVDILPDDSAGWRSARALAWRTSSELWAEQRLLAADLRRRLVARLRGGDEQP